MNEAMLFDVPANPQHPAKYTDILLPVMAGMLRGRKTAAFLRQKGEWRFGF